ncbi:MAG: class I SAM-dependent methyltransferase, partial [Deltaproteobacteria bacterium]|nr:class I SAM-dependent methyltransferase [Deltaproteobacteria bacterium]
MSNRKEEIKKRFDSLAGQRDKWIARNRYYYDDQARYFRFLIPEGMSVLELGCGTGDLLNALKPGRGAGIDISPEMIKVAKEKHPHLEFRQGNIEELASRDETFDFIVMSDVVGHLQDIEETLRGFRSFCRPDTRIIISYYNFLWEPVLKSG